MNPSNMHPDWLDPEDLAIVVGARSLLFVPGDRSDRFEKAAASGADGIVLDLEDAVAADHRPAARESVVAWLSNGGRGTVRINPVGEMDHDLDVAALEGAPGLIAALVAKAEDPDALTSVSRRLGVPVVGLLETAAGVARAREIAAAAGVARLGFGHLDLAADLGCATSHIAMHFFRSEVVLASRAAGLPGPMDGVTTALEDPDALRGDLEHARELGLTGKLLIHPKQVEGTHDAYRPTQDEIDWAERVLAAVAEGGTGAVRLDGDMIDPPVVALAHDILRRRDR